jgi:hypothetical protein
MPKMSAKDAVRILVFVLVSAGAAFGNTAVAELARAAVGTDAASAKTAIAELRALGPKGLEALMVQYSAQIERFKQTGDATEEWWRIAKAIDTVAMQKDAYASGLFWETDLDAAIKIARDSDKPILSLRLLGNLNEEFSCANSRLFRSILYTDPAISKYLRENYVLHWRSVRPAPKVTIDFGDGRKIERTLTGNSIHYILDENGTIVDGLPGLYSPKAFKIYLEQGKLLNASLEGFRADTKNIAMMRYRKLSFDRIREGRENAVNLAKVTLIEPAEGTDAILAAPRAMAKMAVTDEISILRVYDDFARFEPKIDLSDWKRLSGLYSPNTALDPESIAFIRRQNRNTGRSEAEFDAMLAKLKEFIALDTTRNDFLYHLKIYEWLNRGNAGSINLEAFNDRVYSDIFQTPNSDRWLGLYSSDVYTALDGNGVIQ